MPPAGITYGAFGVAEWDKSIDEKADAAAGAALPLWHRALFMPAAKQLAFLAGFMKSKDYWMLRPQPGMLPVQPGDSSPENLVAAAATEAKDFAAIYDPQEKNLNIAVDALPKAPQVTWFNPRTGQTTPAVAVVGAQSCQFPTPETGDWVLSVRAGK